MDKSDFESFEDFANYLSTQSQDEIVSSWESLVALFEKMQDNLDSKIPREDFQSFFSIPRETLKQALSTFEKQIPNNTTGI